MKFKKILFFFISFLVLFFSSNNLVFAAKKLNRIDGLYNNFYPVLLFGNPVIDAGPDSPAAMINKIVTSIIGILTIIGGCMFLVMFLLGGVRWMTSSGKQEQLERAKSQLTNSAIGLIIVVAAFGLNFLLASIFDINFLNPGSLLTEVQPQNLETIQNPSAPFEAIDPSGGPQNNELAPNKVNLLFSTVIGFITLFGGIFFIVYFLLGALQWVGSGGVPERIEKAKKQISSAVIGLIIIVATYTIAFIVGSVLGINILSPGENFYILF